MASDSSIVQFDASESESILGKNNCNDFIWMLIL